MEKLKKQPKFQLSQPSGAHTATWPNQWADRCATRDSSPPPFLHARRGAMFLHQQRQRARFLHLQCAQVRAAQLLPFHQPSPTCGPRSAFFTILRAPFVQVGPESSLARSKLQVFTQFARAMCPSLPKSPIVMRHMASPKSNSLSVAKNLRKLIS